MYGIYANIWGILMVNVTIFSSTMDPMGMIYHNTGIIQHHTTSFPMFKVESQETNSMRVAPYKMVVPTQFNVNVGYDIPRIV